MIFNNLNFICGSSLISQKSNWTLKKISTRSKLIIPNADLSLRFTPVNSVSAEQSLLTFKLWQLIYDILYIILHTKYYLNMSLYTYKKFQRKLPLPLSFSVSIRWLLSCFMQLSNFVISEVLYSGRWFLNSPLELSGLLPKCHHRTKHLLYIQSRRNTEYSYTLTLPTFSFPGLFIMLCH